MREHTKEQNGEKWEQRLGGWHLAWLIDRTSGDNLIIANFQAGFGSSSLIAWRLPVNTWVALTLSLFLIAIILYSSYSSTPLSWYYSSFLLYEIDREGHPFFLCCHLI